MSHKNEPSIAGDAVAENEPAPSLKLYNVWNFPDLPFPVVPCSPARDWVKAAGGIPYRCLPIKIVGEFGWSILSPARFTACWDGSDGRNGVEIEFEAGEYDHCIQSHFGFGILTFSFPYLFRTPPGINLWVKGPANWFRDGVQPLEGMVETDWSSFPFTMNWKLTRPHLKVIFEIGDPICVIVPFPRNFVEQFQPEVLPLSAEPAMEHAVTNFKTSRKEHIEKMETGGTSKHAWQRHYHRGLDLEENLFPNHQTHLNLLPFVVKESEGLPAVGENASQNEAPGNGAGKIFKSNPEVGS